MYSLNVPVPAAVGRLAGDLARDVPGATPRPRDERTLVVKRLGDAGGPGADRLAARVREAVAGTDPFEAAVDRVDYFEDPVTGTGPVVYLAVASPELRALHRRLCGAFEPVDHLEGDAYTPHVTIARGGEVAAAERLADGAIDRVDFAVTELVLWDAHRHLPTTRFSLPVR